MLITEPNLERPDDFYEALLDAQLADLNGDGKVDILDVGIASKKSGTSLPPSR